ncbi:MAG TPA: M28 family peptidase [Blastocatellia bacterium]|nr:M28 family peptidase [Blastocatellia bacterium]
MKQTIPHIALVVALVVVSLGGVVRQQTTEGGSKLPPEVKAALQTITSEDLLQHIKILASDEFEGRTPGTKGEQLTVNYLVDKFKHFGLKAGNTDGTYIQKVPLVGITSESTASFAVGRKKIDLRSPDDYVVISPRFTPEVTVKDSDIVFVGYGIVAPEYGWDDYKGTVMSGKTLLMLSGEPDIQDPADPTKLDEKMFKGRAMTRYALGGYKSDLAAELGAAAVIIVHANKLGAYPYASLVGELSRERVYLKESEKNIKPVAASSFITVDGAKRLISAGGQDLETLHRAALSKDFRPVTLDVKASFHLKNRLREFESRNVIALCDGSDANLRREYVIYTAHWDHLGRDEKLTGDQIFNGAVDNASGTAALLEIANAFMRLAPPPKRSILFLATTAEEAGLLGAKYYTSRPLYPLSTTLADINMDIFFPFGRSRDILSVSYGYSTLDEILSEAALTQGRTVKPDFFPQAGSFYRSDQFAFAQAGVPVLYASSGLEIIGKPPGYALGKLLEWNSKYYHKVSDEVRPEWDLSGTVEDLKLLFTVGYRVAQADRYPEWKPAAEFKRRHEHNPVNRKK